MLHAAQLLLMGTQACHYGLQTHIGGQQADEVHCTCWLASDNR